LWFGAEQDCQSGKMDLTLKLCLDKLHDLRSLNCFENINIQNVWTSRISELSASVISANTTYLLKLDPDDTNYEECKWKFSLLEQPFNEMIPEMHVVPILRLSLDTHLKNRSDRIYVGDPRVTIIVPGKEKEILFRIKVPPNQCKGCPSCQEVIIRAQYWSKELGCIQKLLPLFLKK
jgi:hypothetical protein